jgi:hypothetical protein
MAVGGNTGERLRIEKPGGRGQAGVNEQVGAESPDEKRVAGAGEFAGDAGGGAAVLVHGDIAPVVWLAGGQILRQQEVSRAKADEGDEQQRERDGAPAFHEHHSARGGDDQHRKELEEIAGEETPA